MEITRTATEAQGPNKRVGPPSQLTQMPVVVSDDDGAMQVLAEAWVQEFVMASKEMRPTRATLQDAARRYLAGVEDLRDVVRIVSRELNEFPDVVMPAVDRVLDVPIRLHRLVVENPT